MQCSRGTTGYIWLELFKRGKCNSGTEFFIVFNFNLNSHIWVVAVKSCWTVQFYTKKAGWTLVLPRTFRSSQVQREEEKGEVRQLSFLSQERDGCKVIFLGIKGEKAALFLKIWPKWPWASYSCDPCGSHVRDVTGENSSEKQLKKTPLPSSQKELGLEPQNRRSISINKVLFHAWLFENGMRGRT